MLKRKKKVIAKVMATTMLATTIATTFGIEAKADSISPRTAVSSSKISGSDRYKTAVEISKNYSSSSKHAVIVNGQKGIVDALTATPYASLKNAPILMTQSNKLNADTKAELTRRGIKTVDIVGGVNSVNDSVKSEIQAMGITVNRIAGSSKYDTALEVAKKIDAISDISKIAVANGEVLADAVSVAAPAAQNEMPIILAHPKNGLDDKTKSYINGEGVSTSYVIGGTNSVSNTTQNSLPGTKKRLEGSGRQDTNAAVVKEFYTSNSYDNVYVTKSGQVNTQDEIADALAVGVLAAKEQDPVMIVGKSLANSQANLLADKSFTKVTEIGNGIPNASMESIKNTQNTVKEVTTVSALNSALESAKDGDTINFKPSSTVAENVKLSTNRNVTVNLDGTHSKPVTVDMENATLNINGNISEKVSVDAIKTLKVKSGVTVKHLEIKSGAKNASVTNSGTVTTFDVLATGVKISGSGNITTLNPYNDTNFDNVTGNIGNIDASKPVSQVTVQNGKELVIRFSKSVDPQTVLNGDKLKNSNIVITKIGTAQTITGTEAKAELDDSRRTLTITPQTTEYFDGNYGLEIKDVTSNSVKLDTYNTTFFANDTVAPQISSVEFNQNTNKFEINLSEPVVNLDGLVLRINDKSIPVGVEAAGTSTAVLDSSKKKITIIRTDSIAELGKTANIYIARIKDAAGNIMQSYNSSVSVSKSDLNIESVSALANDKIRVKFNKALSADSDTKITGASNRGIVVNKSNDSNTNKIDYIKSIAKTSSSVDDTGRTYDITLNDVLGSNSSQSLKVVVSKDAYKDKTGLTIGSVTRDVTINKDTTKPTVTSTVLNTSSDAIEVTFNEAITKPAVDNTKIKLMKNTLPVDISSFEVENDKTLVIKCNAETTSGKLNAGNYQVHFKEGSIQDLSGNEIVAVNTSIIEVTETSTPSKPLDINVYAEGESIPATSGIPSGFALKDNEFLVVAPDGRKFDTDMFGSGKKPNEHFKIDIKNTLTTLPENTEISFIDNGYNEIKVSLPDDYVKETGTYTLDISGLVLEKDGDNSIETKKNDRSIHLIDNSAPTLQTAKLETVKNSNGDISKYELRLVFDDEIQLVDASDLDYDTEHDKNINLLLPSLEIKTGSNIYDKNLAYNCKYQVKSNNKKEVIVLIDPSDVKDDTSWKNTLGSSSTSTLAITSELNLIRDTDSIEKDGSKLKAKKVNAITISKTSRVDK